MNCNFMLSKHAGIILNVFVTLSRISLATVFHNMDIELFPFKWFFLKNYVCNTFRENNDFGVPNFKIRDVWTTAPKGTRLPWMSTYSTDASVILGVFGPRRPTYLVLPRFFWNPGPWNPGTFQNALFGFQTTCSRFQDACLGFQKARFGIQTARFGFQNACFSSRMRLSGSRMHLGFLKTTPCHG